MDPPPELTLKDLGDRLQERLDVIADTRLAKSDPATHLEKLKAASEAIFELQHQLEDQLPVRLKHFLEQSSYNKALAFIRDLPREA